jgi:hypothetical protein
MARTINRLAARSVTTINKPGRHADGGGLYLSVDGSGRRRWVFMSWRAGKQIEVGLGSAKSGTVDFVSLAKARKAADAIRQRVSGGEDIRSAKDEPLATPSFEAAVTAYIANHGTKWKNAKHRAQWVSTMATYAEPISKKMVDAIGEDDVLRILEPIWVEKSETAARVRGRIEAVLNFAKAKRWRTGDNPAGWGHLQHILPARSVNSHPMSAPLSL